MTASISFVLEPIPPFRLDLTVWTLRRRPDNMIDRWDGKTYRRVLIDDGKPIEIAVTQFDELEMPRLRVVVTSELATSDQKGHVTSAVERLLGIHVDLTEFYQFGENDEVLRPLFLQFQGLKPPRFQTYFETLVNAIACQQLTLTVGIRLLNRLAKTCGPTFVTDEGTFYGFPCPQALAKMEIEQLRSIGFSYQKAGYLIGLARAITGVQFNLEEIEMLKDEEAVSHLCSLKGVGRWTAEYFLLRGLGRTHIFPGDDVGARKNLQLWLNLPDKLNYSDVHKTLMRWDGYGGLIYFHLLLKSLTEKGIVPNGKEQLC